ALTYGPSPLYGPPLVRNFSSPDQQTSRSPRRAIGYARILSQVRWSGGLRERVDALPRGGDRIGPWPGRLDFQAAAPPAADQPGGVQDAASSALLWPGRRPRPAA